MICGDQLYLHTFTCRIEYVLDTFLVLVYMNAKYTRQLHLEIAYKFFHVNFLKSLLQHFYSSTMASRPSYSRRSTPPVSTY